MRLRTNNADAGLTRNRWVMEQLATSLLEARVGDRFVKLADLQAAYSVGAGTVQTAIKNLEAFDAIALRRSGHKGTQIEAIDYGRLWSISGRGPITGIFPPASLAEARKAEARMTAIFSAAGLPFKALHRSGALRRVQAIKDSEADFAFVSNAVYQELSKAKRAAWRAIKLEKNSFYDEGSLSVLTRPNFDPRQKPVRIGVDVSSVDHRILNDAEFGGKPNHDVVECPYMDIPRLLIEGKIDRSVWHRIDMVIPLELVGIGTQNLSEPKAIDIVENMSHAVVLANNSVVCRLIEESLIAPSKRTTARSALGVSRRA